MDAQPTPSRTTLPPTEQPVTSSVHHQIRIATRADLPFIHHLQRKFSNHVGFLPAPALEKYLDRGAIWLTAENGQPAGYVIRPPALAWQPLLRPILQACVAMDAQRRGHALQLLQLIEYQTVDAGQVGLQANCRTGLEANEFWRAAGFTEICRLDPQNARDQHIICWRKPLIKQIPLWFAMPPLRAGYRAAPPRLAHRQKESTDATRLPHRNAAGEQQTDTPGEQTPLRP